MYTIVESEIFTKMVSDILTQAEQEELASFLAVNPDCGDVIPSSGGCRKMRWQRQGMGKRGGSRVIYFNRLEKRKNMFVVNLCESKI